MSTGVATKHLYDPSLGSSVAEDLCDDHAGEALQDAGVDRHQVTAVPPGTPCSRCAEVPSDVDRLHGAVVCELGLLLRGDPEKVDRPASEARLHEALNDLAGRAAKLAELQAERAGILAQLEEINRIQPELDALRERELALVARKAAEEMRERAALLVEIDPPASWLTRHEMVASIRALPAQPEATEEAKPVFTAKPIFTAGVLTWIPPNTTVRGLRSGRAIGLGDTILEDDGDLEVTISRVDGEPIETFYAIRVSRGVR